MSVENGGTDNGLPNAAQAEMAAAEKRAYDRMKSQPAGEMDAKQLLRNGDLSDIGFGGKGGK